ncbi:MAG: pyridoxal phosphate-dependent aminotransferase [Lachnospiraceae bacterium]|nr:pyridoxal phosphate-dependent aminotransferase [Lachnospiraceae bacterium]
MGVDRDIFEGADRIKDCYFSPVRVVSERVFELQQQGHEFVNFGEGEPDFDTPKGIVDATINALQNKYTHYANNRGLIELRQEISKLSQEVNGIYYNPEDEIIVTSAGAETINDAIMAFLNPGDEAIIFTPAFFNYENLILMAGATVVDIPLKGENGFQIDPDELRRNITSKTKMIIINNPCNPTGVVFSNEVLTEVAKIAVENNLIVFSDEIYSKIIYGEDKFRSMASFPGMRERTIIGNGFSKLYSMTGWRVGYLLFDKRMMASLLKVHHYCVTCTPTFIQKGLADAMNLPEVKADGQKMVDTYSRRRDLVCKYLDMVPEFKYAQPRGAFYVFVDVSETGIDGDEFAERLREERFVATIPGSGLGGENFKNYIRISFVTDEKNVEKGMQEILGLVSELREVKKERMAC